MAGAPVASLTRRRQRPTPTTATMPIPMKPTKVSRLASGLNQGMPMPRLLITKASNGVTSSVMAGRFCRMITR